MSKIRSETWWRAVGEKTYSIHSLEQHLNYAVFLSTSTMANTTPLTWQPWQLWMCVFKCWLLPCLCGLWSDCFHVSKFTQVIMASQDKAGQLLCIVQFTAKIFKKELNLFQDFYLSQIFFFFFFWYSSYSFIFGLDTVWRSREPHE